MPEKEVEQEEVAQEREYTETEQLAMKKGWQPPEQAIANGLSEEDAVSAETFLHVEPWDKQLKIERQRNNTLSKKLDQIMDRWDKAETQGYERAVAELEARKQAAYDELDVDEVKRIDAELYAQEQERQKLEKERQQRSAEPDPAVLEFIDNNRDWWGTDQAAMQFAGATATALGQSNPNMPTEDVLVEVQKRVNAFRGVTDSTSKKAKVSYVAPPTRGTQSSSKSTYSAHDLSSEARDVYMSMKRYRQDEFGEDYSINDFVKAQLDTGMVDKKELFK